MPIQPDFLDIQRIGLEEAIKRVMDVLKKGTPMYISRIAREANVDRRMVRKVVDILLEVQNTLQLVMLETERIGRKLVIHFQERVTQARDFLEGKNSTKEIGEN